MLAGLHRWLWVATLCHIAFPDIAAMVWPCIRLNSMLWMSFVLASDREKPESTGGFLAKAARWEVWG
jgi:hypothetical protein